MRNEISSAVDFLSNILKCKGDELLKLFRENLSDLLCEHYENHWFPEKPYKGSGYRCLRIVNNKMDPLLAKAGASSGISVSELLNILPTELTMWVDPEEVSYRIGEEGSIGVLYEGAQQTSATSSPSTSASSSPSPVEMYHQPAAIHPQEYTPQQSQDMYQTCKSQARNYYIPGLPQDSTYLNSYLAAYVSS